MRTAIFRNGQIKVDTVPDPVPEQGQVLVRTLRCGICGTDLHAAKHTRQFVDLANLAGVLVLSLGLGLWLIPRSGARGAGLAISISILAWSLAELMEGWILFRLPPFNRHLVPSLFLAGLVFGAGFLLQDHVSSAIEAILVGGLYVSLSFLFVCTPSDRDLLRRAIKKISLSMTQPAVASSQN